MLLSWNDYYSGSGTDYSQKTQRLASFSGTAYIKNSLFDELLISGYGGSIYYSSSSSLLMLIESSTFVYCQSTGLGGAIFFDNSGQYVMVKVCGYGCKSTSYQAHFEYVQVTNSISSKNEIHDSVICCTTQTSQSHEIIHHYGKIVYKQTNFSSNKCYSVASIYANPTSNGNSAASSISYISVSNNVVSYGNCIYLSSSYLHEVDSCNFISNTDLSSGYGLIKVSGSLNLRGSCILNNSATYVIYNDGGKTITVTNCTIDSTSTYYGSITFISTPKTSFINKIDHIETALCYAKYDSVGSLTVVPNITKTYPNGIPPDKIEIILEMYCNKHMSAQFIRHSICLLMHSLISL
jgi:hypothetical protein